MAFQFIVPSDEALDQVVHSICMELGRQNPVCLRREVCHGLAVYLKIVAVVHIRMANTMNSGLDEA